MGFSIGLRDGCVATCSGGGIAAGRYTLAVMAMYHASPIPTRTPLDRPRTPVLKAGDRVRFRRADEAIPGHGPEDGAMGTVQRVNGEAVVVQLDQPFEAAGLTMHTFHSYARELEPIARVGKLGGEDLFADDEDSGTE